MIEKFRLWIQLIFTALTNGYIAGFLQGKIYQGKGKYACVPGLNCYSCPGAVGSCPIGALQSMLTQSKKEFPFYIVGVALFFGVTFGRFICGFLCPFGLVQDLLYKIKTKKFKLPVKLHKALVYLKYLILLVAVILLPIFATDKFGLSDPYFCKWICPSGTLFGGIPLLSLNEGLRANIGTLFSIKATILGFIIVTSVISYRPFCKYLCPLGAFYGMFNSISFYRLEVDFTSCTNCKQCEKRCPMQVQVLKNINSPECIRCGECKKACNHGCITNSLDRYKLDININSNSNSKDGEIFES